MTELQLYKFVANNTMEYHWHSRNNTKDVILFVNILWIREFNEMLGSSNIMDEEGIECTMKDGYFCFWMNDICNYFDIDMNNVFDKTE